MTGSQLIQNSGNQGAAFWNFLLSSSLNWRQSIEQDVLLLLSYFQVLWAQENPDGEMFTSLSTSARPSLQCSWLFVKRPQQVPQGNLGPPTEQNTLWSQWSRLTLLYPSLCVCVCVSVCVCMCVYGTEERNMPSGQKPIVRCWKPDT